MFLAMTLNEYVSELKNKDIDEWNKLKDIKLRHWTGLCFAKHRYETKW